MKPFAKLTADDLRRSPVWRYESADCDSDAVVEADDRAALSERDSSVFVASTTFHLVDGSEWLGLCSPADSSGLDYLQPVILAGARHLHLWSGGPSGKSVPDVLCEGLGRRVSQVFPISFTCNVPVDGKLVSGTIRLAGALPNLALQLTVNLSPFGRSDDRS